MGFLADVANWFNGLGNTIVNAIVEGSAWVTARLREIRGAMVTAMTQALSNPWSAIATIIGLVLVQVGLQQLWEALKQVKAVQRIVAFLTGIGELIKTVATWAQLDLMITVIKLGALVNQGFYAQISRVYMALGDIAVELEVDFNFITSFLEVNRSIIYTTYSITGLGAVKAEADYAAGLAGFLRGVTNRLGDYAKDPSLIFTDIQSAIIVNRASKAEQEIGKVWSAIDKSSKWISSSGSMLIGEVATIDGILRGMPDQMQGTVRQWFDPLKKKVDDFENLTWKPFWSDYQAASQEITGYFHRHGVEIQALEDSLRSPIDILRAILYWPPDRLKEATLDLDEITSKGIRDAMKESDKNIGEIAGVMAEIALLPLPSFAKPSIIEIAMLPLPGEITKPVVTAPGWFVGESGASPWAPGKMSADGRGWFVGGE
jgi:hypothetical protein